MLLVSADERKQQASREKARWRKKKEKREEKSFYFLVFPKVVALFFQSAFFTILDLSTFYLLWPALNLVKAQEMDTNLTSTLDQSAL